MSYLRKNMNLTIYITFIVVH